jgi:hypothetical protein
MPVARPLRPQHLLLELTIEDKNVFTTPWSANVIYRPVPDIWPESVCAENPNEIMRKAALPIADKPDFRLLGLTIPETLLATADEVIQ